MNSDRNPLGRPLGYMSALLAMAAWSGGPRQFARPAHHATPKRNRTNAEKHRAQIARASRLYNLRHHAASQVRRSA